MYVHCVECTYTGPGGVTHLRRLPQLVPGLAHGLLAVVIVEHLGSVRIVICDTPTETGFPDPGYLRGSVKRWTAPPFENHLKIQSHFYRAHACFVKYFLMTEKFQHIRKLA